MLLNTSPPYVLSQPHDKVFKTMLLYEAVAKDLMCQYLPHDLIAEIDWSSIKMMPPEFIDDKLRQYVADVVYYVRFRNDQGSMYCLLEHQSSADADMMRRMLQYTCQVISRHARQHEGKMPLVMPILIYNGTKTSYPYSIDIADYLPDIPSSRFLQFRLARLVDLTMMTDDFLLQQESSALLQLLLKHIRLKDFLPIFEKKILSHIRKLRVRGRDAILKTFFECVFLTTELSDRQYFIDLVRQDSAIKIGGEAMTPAEFLHDLGMKEGVQQGMERGVRQGMERGMAQGFEKGIKTGKDKKAHTLVLNLIKEGCDVPFIVRVTGVAEKKVQEIKNSMLGEVGR